MNKSTRIRKKILFCLTFLIVGSGIFFISSFYSTDRNNSLQIQGLATDKSLEMTEDFTELWNVSWDKNDYDGGEEVVAGSSGIYVVGTFQDEWAMVSDIDLTKVDFNGNLVWNRTLGGSGGTFSYGYGVAVDSSDNVYLCGSYDRFLGYSVWLFKFDSDGNEVWNKTWYDYGSAHGRGLLLDSSGNIYVCGFTDTVGGDTDILLIKFAASDGTKLWNTTWGGPQDDEGFGLVRDPTGNLYVCGEKRVGSADDLVIVKFDANGVEIWNSTWGGNSWDGGEKIEIDSSGNLYVVGHTQSYGAGGSDLAFLKFYPNGTRAWNLTWGGSLDDHGYDVKIDSLGYLYVCGYSRKFSVNSSTLVIKFDTDGTMIWNFTWGGPYNNRARGIAIDSIGSIYVCGYASTGYYTDFSLIRYLEPPIAPTLEPITPNPDKDGEIDLNWFGYRSTSYYVYRDNTTITSVSGLIPIAVVPTSAYTDNIEVEGIYFYAIIAGNVLGNSTLSTNVNVTVTFKGIPGFAGFIILFEPALIVLYFYRKRKKTWF